MKYQTVLEYLNERFDTDYDDYQQFEISEFELSFLNRFVKLLDSECEGEPDDAGRPPDEEGGILYSTKDLDWAYEEIEREDGEEG
jgi:hypothetical protein